MLTEFAVTRDVELRNTLVVRHLPLVKFVARKMSSSLPGNVEFDDLVSWGSIGLIDAIEKFEPERGLQFSTYAVTRIRGDILDGLQRMEWAPKQVTAQVRRMRRAVSDLQHELGREAVDAEIAEKLGVTEAEVRAARLDDKVTRVRALEWESAYDGDNSETSMWLAEEADQAIAGETAEIRRRMADALAGIDTHEARVLFLYYDQAMTLKEIAAELGISVSSATQAHTRLVDRVRRRLAEVHGSVA